MAPQMRMNGFSQLLSLCPKIDEPSQETTSHSLSFTGTLCLGGFFCLFVCFSWTGKQRLNHGGQYEEKENRSVRKKK